jgi:hypothetical protein
VAPTEGALGEATVQALGRGACGGATAADSITKPSPALSFFQHKQ